MDWERAAKRDQVRERGADPVDRQVLSGRVCEHRWKEWAQAGVLDLRWRRECATCGRVQVRATRPRANAPAPAARTSREPVSRTKGDLVIRKADGSVERVTASDECRSAEQTEWLTRHARQSSSSGTTRVLVVTPSDSATVVAYYAWCMASVSLADAPARIARTLAVANEIGCRALLVHAETTEAKDFYRHLVPELESSPTDDLHLLLLMKDSRRTFR